MSRMLSVTLKTVERCNIDCKYCYYFYGGDDSYKVKPSYMKRNTIIDIVQFLKRGCEDLAIDNLVIEFHGGEPLMQKRSDFDFMCNYFLSQLAKDVKLDFIMQTNAMLINNEWMDLFEKYDVDIGVSIDGTKEYHDYSRVDHLGRGTYDRVVDKVSLYQQRFGNEKLGVLCVINPSHCAKKIYRHFVDDLRFKTIEFLLPFDTHDDIQQHSSQAYGYFIRDVFDEWLRDDDPTIHVRIIESIIDLLLGRSSGIYGIGPPQNNNILPFICISSDGSLGPVDELRVTEQRFRKSDTAVSNTALKEYLSSPLFETISTAQRTLPSLCSKCMWKKACWGGGLVNRYSKENIFNNPSVFCDGLKHLYEHIYKGLIKSGIDSKQLQAVLE